MTDIRSHFLFGACLAADKIPQKYSFKSDIFSTCDKTEYCRGWTSWRKDCSAGIWQRRKPRD